MAPAAAGKFNRQIHVTANNFDYATEFGMISVHRKPHTSADRTGGMEPPIVVASQKRS
jgi:hypothetical protein